MSEVMVVKALPESARKPRHLGRPLNRLAQQLYVRRHRDLFAGREYPESIYLELTSVCNLRCPMCPKTFMERTPSHVKVELVEKLADELARFHPRCPFLSLHGFGEAVLHPKLAEILPLLRQKLPLTNLTVSVNLASAKPKHIDVLFESVHEIGVWIDAADKETYETQRERGVYEETLATLEYLLARKRASASAFPLFHIGMVLTKLNVAAEPEFVRTWRARFQGIPGVGIRTVRGINFNGRIDERLLLKPRSERFLYKPCDSPFKTALILASGEVTLCCFDAEGESAVGNLNDMTLKEAWHSERARQIRADAYNADHKLEMCLKCDFMKHYPLDGRPAGAEHLSYAEATRAVAAGERAMGRAEAASSLSTEPSPLATGPRENIT